MLQQEVLYMITNYNGGLLPDAYLHLVRKKKAAN